MMVTAETLGFDVGRLICDVRGSTARLFCIRVTEGGCAVHFGPLPFGFVQLLIQPDGFSIVCYN